MTSVDDHVAWCRLRNLRPGTITQRTYALGRLRRRLDRDPLSATYAELCDHLGRLEHAETRATELSHLRQFFKWAQAEDLRLDEPTARIPRPRTHRGLPRPFGEEDLAMAFALAPPRERAWILLGGWAGLRCAEIAPLRAEHVSERAILIQEAKGGHAAVQPSTEWLAWQLSLCDLPRSGWLFPYCARATGQPGPMPPHRVSQLGAKYFRSIGIDATMHQLRHRFLTQAQRVTHDILQTKELARHESITSTQIYTLLDREDLRAVMAAIPLPHYQPTLF